MLTKKAITFQEKDQHDLQKRDNIFCLDYNQKVLEYLKSDKIKQTLADTADNGNFRLNIINIKSIIPETWLDAQEARLSQTEYKARQRENHEAYLQCGVLKRLAKTLNRKGDLPARLDYDEFINLHTYVYTSHVKCLLAFDWTPVSNRRLAINRFIGKIL